MFNKQLVYIINLCNAVKSFFNAYWNVAPICFEPNKDFIIRSYSHIEIAAITDINMINGVENDLLKLTLGSQLISFVWRNSSQWMNKQYSFDIFCELYVLQTTILLQFQ